MTSIDALDRLRTADPARELDPSPPDDLLQALLATSRPSAPHGRAPRSRRRSWRVLLVASAVTVAVAVATVVLVPGTDRNLAAQAYAQTTPQNEQILYIRTTEKETIDFPGTDRDRVETSISEAWQRRGISRRVTVYGRHQTEETLDAHGVLRLRVDGKLQTPDGVDEHEQREYIDRVRRGFVENFRRAYERGRLDESGDTRFAGRSAKRYVVTGEPPPATVGAPPTHTEEYYLDAKTGAPLGYRRVSVVYTPRIEDRRAIPDHDAPTGTDTFVSTVDELEHLAPTPENLAKLSD